MRKIHAKNLRNGDEVEIRFLAEDTWTPNKWEAGKVAGDPIENGDGVFVPVLLNDGTYVHRVKYTLIR